MTFQNGGPLKSLMSSFTKPVAKYLICQNWLKNSQCILKVLKQATDWLFSNQF